MFYKIEIIEKVTLKEWHKLKIYLKKNIYNAHERENIKDDI